MKKHVLFVFSQLSLILIPALCLFPSHSYSQATIEGYAFLKEETDHSGIEVTLTQTVPLTTKYITYTDNNGYYKSDIDIGVYDIAYSKNGYYGYSEKDVELFNDRSLEDVNLVKIGQYIQVPESYTTIQSAINAANPLDTIVVSPGTYNESIDFLGKNIVITSNYTFTADTSDISNTIIDGENGGRVVSILSGSTSAALIGFTITHGYNPYESENLGKGGGIIVRNGATPLLENLIITDNASDTGGGIYIYSANPLIRNVVICNNTARYGGGIYSQTSKNVQLINVKVLNNSLGGIVNYRGRLSITNSIISNNGGTRGGGLELYAASDCQVYNSIISNNSASGDGGGIIVFGSPLSVYNSIITENRGKYGIFVSTSDPSEVRVFNSNCWNNSSGNYYNCGPYLGKLVTENTNGDSCDLFRNISMDPDFINENDYTLSLKSPCVDAGNNDYSFTDQDINGTNRILDGDNSGDSIVDIGPGELAFHIDLGPGITACEYAELKIDGDFQTYDWNNGLSNDDTLIVHKGGKYTLEVSDTFGRVFSDSIFVTIHDLPHVDLGPDTSICGHIELSAGAKFIQYKWNNGFFHGDPLMVNTSDHYFVFVTDTNNCSNYSDTIYIAVKPVPEKPTISGETNPYNSGAYYYSVPYDPELGYSWEVPEESSIDNPDTSYVGIQWANNGKNWIKAVAENSYGCISDTATLEINIRTLGVSPDTKLSDLRLFPNPVKDVLNIETQDTGPFQLTITSLNGKVLFSREYSDPNCRIDLSPFPKGTYLIAVKSDNKLSTSRIIKH